MALLLLVQGGGTAAATGYELFDQGGGTAAASYWLLATPPATDYLLLATGAQSDPKHCEGPNSSIWLRLQAVPKSPGVFPESLRRPLERSPAVPKAPAALSEPFEASRSAFGAVPKPPGALWQPLRSALAAAPKPMSPDS